MKIKVVRVKKKKGDTPSNCGVHKTGIDVEK